MTRRTVVADSRTLLVAVDDAPPVAERWSALATGLAVDEETGQAAATRMSGGSPQLGVTVTAPGDGSFCPSPAHGWRARRSCRRPTPSPQR